MTGAGGRRQPSALERTDYTLEGLMDNPGERGAAMAAVRFGSPQARESARRALSDLRAAVHQLRKAQR
jgi:hypothetical protein